MADIGTGDGDLRLLAETITAITSPFRNYLSDLHEQYQGLETGQVTTDLPVLAATDPSWFGICVVTLDGQCFDVGDCARLFTVQSLARALTFGLALEDHGRDVVNSKVGHEPTTEDSHAIVLYEDTHRSCNPMVNAGAIAMTDLINGADGTQRLQRILDMFQRYTGRCHDIDMPIFLSAKANGVRDRAIAYLMLSFDQR